MPTVLVIGTLDTKGDELAFACARLRDAGVDVLVADAGTVGPPHGVEPDISREALAGEVGADVRSLTDRGAAVGTMADAAAATEGFRAICAGASSRLTLPALGFTGTPLGVDARKVVELDIPPKVTTGILHVSDGSGQVGAGVATAPLECFVEAVHALAARLI
jgi:uncharacterized protein (UPF0261 family)